MFENCDYLQEKLVVATVIPQNLYPLDGGTQVGRFCLQALTAQVVLLLSLSLSQQAVPNSRAISSSSTLSPTSKPFFSSCRLHLLIALQSIFPFVR